MHSSETIPVWPFLNQMKNFYLLEHYRGISAVFKLKINYWYLLKMFVLKEFNQYKLLLKIRYVWEEATVKLCSSMWIKTFVNLYLKHRCMGASMDSQPVTMEFNC